MLDFWIKALNIYFKKYNHSFLSRFDDLMSFFTLEGTYPIGMSAILTHLVHQKQFFIIQKESQIILLN